MDTDFQKLADALEVRFEASTSDPWVEDAFASAALDCFRHQYAACAPYRALCAARGATPEEVARWHDVPMVPATAFKHFDFHSGGGAPSEAVFRTSGTTRGAGRRGRHPVPRLSLYRAAALPPLAAALLPEGGRIRMASLIPPPEEAPESSLSTMAGFAAERYGSTVEWLVDARGAWRPDAGRAFHALAEEGEPVLLLGTALAFLHALDSSEVRLPCLPEGSRIMETGGFKGARRSVSRQELHAALVERMGVEGRAIVNEYGMTELLSQLWEPVLTEGVESAGWHRPAPWLRVRALDPMTLEPLPEGREGVLAFFDLANLGSVSHVLTEDIGSIVKGRVRLRGRAPGSEPRGCSRAMDELMAAAGG